MPVTLPYESATSGERALRGRGNGPGKRTHGNTCGGDWSHKYRAWAGMLGRARDRTSPRARWYAGVHVYPAWVLFEAFDADVPDPPSREHTLDRINGAFGYEPGNVRWATKKEQARNRRSNRIVTINGRSQCLAAWAEEIGIGEATIRYRIAHGIDPMLPVRRTVLEEVSGSKMLPAIEGPKS